MKTCSVPPKKKSRRSLLVDGIVDRTGITEAMIAYLGTTFYARVRLDPARRIADSFEMAMATQRGRIAAPRHAVQRS